MKKNRFLLKIMAVLGVFQFMFLLGKLSTEGFSYGWSWLTVFIPTITFLVLLLIIGLAMLFVFYFTKDMFK